MTRGRVRRFAFVACVGLMGMGSPIAAQVRVADSEVRAASVLDRLVSVELKDVSLKRAIDELALSAGIRIQYRNATLEEARKPVTLKCSRLPLGDALHRVLAGTDLEIVPLDRDFVAIRSATQAQVVNGEIVGSVVDATTKKPVPGATVSIDGTKLVGLTAEGGTFRFSKMSAGTYVLRVRRIGYKNVQQSVTVTNDATVTVAFAMTPVATALDAVLTTATGKQRRLEIANDIGLINADSLVKEAPITTLSQLLAARVPGLTVTQGQGSVGGDVRLQIRSRSSLTLSSEPIVIVDGVRYKSRPALKEMGELGWAGSRESVSPLNDLNPNDIETVEVVKGPSAATLYGTDASNGVIVITTKRGKIGPPRWEMYGTTDYSEIPQRKVTQDEQWLGWGHYTLPDLTDTTRYCTIRAAVIDGSCFQDSVTHAPSAGSQSQYSLFRPSRPWAMGMNVSGGSSTLRYFLGGDYNQQIAAIGVPDTAIALARARGRLNLPKSFLRPNSQTNLSLRSNVSVSSGEKTDLGINASYTHGQTYSIQAGGIAPYDASLNGSDPYAIANSFLEVFSRTSSELNDRFTGGANLQFRPISWLSTRGTVGIDWSMRNLTDFQERDSTRQEYPLGLANNQYTRQMATTADLGSTARFQWSRMSFQTSVGINYHRSVNDLLRGNGEDLVPGTTAITFASTRTSDQLYDESVTLGSYVEEQVGFNGRLFVTGAYRVDGATGFGDGYRSAGAPKVGASWLLSQEPFFPKVPGITDLRLRTAYGVSLNQARATAKLPFVFITLTPFNGAYSTLPPYLKGYGSIGNPYLRPERSGEWEGGLDASLLEQRVQLGLTWFNRKTHDQIVYTLLPGGLGYINENLGLTTAHGFEANLNMTLIETRPFSLALSLNHSYKTDKLVDLGSTKEMKRVEGGYVEGYPLGSRWNRPFLGYDDINGDGLLVYRGSSDPDNEVFFGDTAVFAGLDQPSRTEQLTVNVGLLGQRVRFSALFDRQAGGTQVLGNNCGLCRANFDSTTPLPEQAAFLRQEFLYNASYRANFTRFREMTVAVTVPTLINRSLRLSSSSIALGVRNLALWTSFPGRDPESTPIDSYDALYSAAANGIPQNRTWTLRFNVGL